jgi:hypothetical protein
MQPSRYSNAGAAAYRSFKVHAITMHSSQVPGASLQGSLYTSVREGLIQVRGVQPGGEDKIVKN